MNEIPQDHITLALDIFFEGNIAKVRLIEVKYKDDEKMKRPFKALNPHQYLLACLEEAKRQGLLVRN